MPREPAPLAVRSGTARLRFAKRTCAKRAACRSGCSPRDTCQTTSKLENRRQRRGRRAVPVLFILGYTNAGKSTLLRARAPAHTEVHVTDQMFATLDPTSRRLRFQREREVIITDTVRFIRDLPPDLVTAFRATLEELADASLLLHLVDAAAPDCERCIEAVRRVLQGHRNAGAGTPRLQPDRPSG